MLDVVAKVLCVRKAQIRPKTDIQQKHKHTRHTDCIHDHGISNSKIEESVSLLPEQTSNGHSHGSVRLITSLEHHVKEIKYYLQKLEEKRLEKEEKDRISHEWVQVAQVLDRIFFVIYVFIIIISVCTIFGHAFF